MKYIIYALAMIILAGSSCKDKSDPPIANEPGIIKENPVPQNPTPENQPTKPSDDHHHHGSGKCDECEKCDHRHKCHHHHGHHKKLPPGHEKKLHGSTSARKYAPGHKKH
jgi:hypothetical protein